MSKRYTNTAIDKSIDAMKPEEVRKATDTLKKVGEMEKKFTPRPLLKKYMKDRFSGKSSLIAKKYIKNTFFGKMKEQKQMEEMLPDGAKVPGKSSEPKWLQEKHVDDARKKMIKSARRSAGIVSTSVASKILAKRLGGKRILENDKGTADRIQAQKLSDVETVFAGNHGREGIRAPKGVAEGVQATGVVGNQEAKGLTQKSRGVATGPPPPSAGEDTRHETFIQ